MRQPTRTHSLSRDLLAILGLLPLAPTLAAASMLSGIIWHDLDGNGIGARGEPGLPGVTIYLDLDHDGEHDAVEPSTVSQGDDPRTTTDETGLWAIDSGPGLVVVRALVRGESVVTFPTKGHRVDVSPFRPTGGLDFGIFDPTPGSVHGTVWSDANGSGARDSDEPGLPGVTIYSDRNFNGRFDHGEPHTISMRDEPATAFDESGLYWLALDQGIHQIRSVDPEETRATFPHDGHRVAIENGKTVEGLDFGFLPLLPSTAHGRTWIDVNANGRRDSNEPGLPGVTIYSDLNRNGQVDSSDPRSISMRDDPNTAFDESGLYWLVLEPGTHLIQEIVPPDGETTFPQDGHLVFLGANEVVEGLDFGFVLEQTGTIHGVVWNDQDRDGFRDASEPGIGGAVVYLDLNQNCIFDRTDWSTRAMYDDPNTVFNEAGMYWLSGVEAGDHVIRVVPPDGHFPIAPLGGARAVHVPIGGTTTGWDFGLALTGGFVTTNPPRIDASSEPGASSVENADITVHPYCVRAYELTVEASDPLALFDNLTGTEINGCGGDTSTFSMRFTAPDGQQCYQLLFRDAEFGGILSSIPVKVVPEPGFGVALVAGVLCVLRLSRRRRSARLALPSAQFPARSTSGDRGFSFPANL